MEKGLDGVVGKGRELGGGGQPAGKVGFERRLVVVACYFRLAGDLHHDLSTPILLGKEDTHASQHSLDAGLPSRITICLENAVRYWFWMMSAKKY